MDPSQRAEFSFAVATYITDRNLLKANGRHLICLIDQYTDALG